MKISIITVCYNSEKTIKDTIESVLNQTYKDYEYLIVDGMSKDSTLNIVKSYEKKFKGKLKIISEKDKGLYDAMNKGIKMASGDIIGIINSDDILANEDVFNKIIYTFKNEKCDAVYGDLVFLDKETMTIPTRNFVAHKPSHRLGWHPPHPTLYIKKDVYNKIGNFNIDYKIAADLDFMLRLINNNYKLVYIPEYLVKMRDGGISTNGLKGYINSLKESSLVLKNNRIKLPYLTSLYRVIKTINQGLSAKINKKNIQKKLSKEIGK